MRTFRGGLLIGLAVAIAVAAAAITYERYDTRTLKRTVRRGEVLCGVNAGLGFSIPDAGRLDRLRCRLLPRGRRGDL
jgi:general L-amino acid transport system substrate-binding protein